MRWVAGGGLVLIPKAREGRGWRRFAAKLTKLEAFFDATINITAVVLLSSSRVSSLAEKCGHRPLFTELVRCLSAVEKGPKVCLGDLVGKDSSVTEGAMG